MPRAMGEGPQKEALLWSGPLPMALLFSPIQWQSKEGSTSPHGSEHTGCCPVPVLKKIHTLRFYKTLLKEKGSRIQ